MEEEEPLPEPPKRSGAEFVRTRRALSNPIGQRGTHVMEREVGIRMILRVRQGRIHGLSGYQRWRMAKRAADLAEYHLSSSLCRGLSNRRWRRGHPYKERKVYDVR